MPTLAVYRGDQFLRHVELDEAPLRIGRAPENELILEDRDKQVSRAHAVIKFERGRYVVYDLKSQNGVWMGDLNINTPVVETTLIASGTSGKTVRGMSNPFAAEQPDSLVRATIAVKTKNGQTVPGATVTLHQQGAASATKETASSGEAVFALLGAGECYFTVEKTGFVRFSSDFLRMRQHGQMAARQAQYLGAHSLRGIGFLLRLDGAVLLRHHKPIRPLAPGRLGNRRPQHPNIGCALHCQHHLPFRVGKVLRKVFVDAFRRQQQKIVPNRLDLAKYRSRWIPRGQSATGFARVGRECGHIHQPRNFSIEARFSNDHSAIRMTHQQHRAILRIDQPVRRSHIISQRIQWILHRDRM